MSYPTQAQMLRLIKEQRGNLKYEIAKAKAKIAGLEAELERTEMAIADIENDEKGDD